MSESESWCSEFDDSGDGGCVSIDDCVGVFALAEYFEGFEGSCGNGCFLFLSDDAVPGEVLFLSFDVCCVGVESGLFSLSEWEEASFFL